MLFWQRRKIPYYQALFLAFGSGLIMGLSPAPLNWWFLSWFSLTPLWWLLFSQKRTTKEIALLGFSWGFGYHSLALFWITGIHPMTWMGVPWLASLAIAIAVWLIIGCWGASLVTVWVVAFRHITSNFLDRAKHSISLTLTRIILGIAIWCSLEALWSHGPLWWSSLSYTQSPSNLIILQLAKI